MANNPAAVLVALPCLFWSFSIVFQHSPCHLYNYARTWGSPALFSTYKKGGGGVWGSNPPTRY